MRLLTTSAVLAIVCINDFEGPLGVDAGEKKKRKKKISWEKKNKMYLKDNAEKSSVHVRKSGMQYEVLETPNQYARKPKPASVMEAFYRGSLINGTVFHSTFESGVPTVMIPRQQVPGLKEALLLMRVGERWEITIPWKLGYGHLNRGPVPGYSTLIFELKLLRIRDDIESPGEKGEVITAGEEALTGLGDRAKMKPPSQAELDDMMADYEKSQKKEGGSWKPPKSEL